MRPLPEPSSFCACVCQRKRVCKRYVPVASLHCLPAASAAGGDVCAARSQASLCVCFCICVTLPPPQKPGPPGLKVCRWLITTPPPLLRSSSLHFLDSRPCPDPQFPHASFYFPLPVSSSSCQSFHLLLIQGSLLLWSSLLQFFPILMSPPYFLFWSLSFLSPLHTLILPTQFPNISPRSEIKWITLPSCQCQCVVHPASTMLEYYPCISVVTFLFTVH